MSLQASHSALFREFLGTRRTALDPQVRDALAGYGLPFDKWFWGLAFVEFSGLAWQPMKGGEAAVIQPVSDAHGVVDLVACALDGRRVATRKGIARAFGEDWIEACIDHQAALPLLADPLGWLLIGRRGTAIVDWSQTASLLDGVPEVLCQTQSLARRVHSTTRRMFQPPRLTYVLKRRIRHAA